MNKSLKNLTDKQEKIIAFIKLKLKSNGFQPSLTEIAKYFGITKQGVYCHLKLIEKKGLIKTTGQSRAINILKLNNMAVK